jgi:REP element-mobilizing transposase RayT
MWFHISVQGNGGQSLFLRNRDILHAIDLLGVFSRYHNVEIIAYNILSNHLHLILECLSPTKFVWGFRISYSKYYNNVYNSFGAIGRSRFTQGKIYDEQKLEEKITYVIRNATRHKVSEHPYCDSFSSVQYYFMEERSTRINKNLTPAGKKCELSYSSQYIPEDYLLDSAGHIYPPSFLQYKTVEKLFKSYSNFIQKISNPTSQEIEENSKIIRIPSIVKINDLVLSEMILEKIKPKTLISLSYREKMQLSVHFKKEYPISVRQLSRVFSIPESTMRRRISEILRHSI